MTDVATWALRYAPHIGYLPPERMMFAGLAGQDPVDHVGFIASLGMAGVLDPWAVGRPPAVREAIGDALREHGLRGGCVVATPLAEILKPHWVADPSSTEALASIERSIDIAKRQESDVLAVILVGDEDVAPAVQRQRARDRLLRAADRCAARGIRIGVEPMVAAPGMLLRSFGEGVELVRSADHPAIKLIFDTGHVDQMGDPVEATLIAAYDDICTIQLADMPGRLEPGSGAIDFVPVLAHAIARGFDGLVELEHHWSAPGAAVECAGIERLRALDRMAVERAAPASGRISSGGVR